MLPAIDFENIARECQQIIALRPHPRECGLNVIISALLDKGVPVWLPHSNTAQEHGITVGLALSLPGVQVDSQKFPQVGGPVACIEGPPTDATEYTFCRIGTVPAFRKFAGELVPDDFLFETHM